MKLQRAPSGCLQFSRLQAARVIVAEAAVPFSIVTPATENEIYQDASAALVLAEGRTVHVKPVFRKVCLLQAASHPDRIASQKLSRPQGLHLVSLTSSGTLAQSFLSLSLSFPIWKVIIPDLTALQSSCEFSDIRAHECGTT